MKKPEPFILLTFYNADSFLTEMLSLGKPLEVSLVGTFDTEAHGRGSRRDIDLPLHKDGVYSAALAEKQGGYFTPPVDIAYVGLYCIREGAAPCLTIIDSPETGRLEFDLKKGQALVFDNAKVLHGRSGPVGERLLIRMWIAAQGEKSNG